MLAFDMGIPARTASTIIQVNVARDRSTLAFSSDNYNAETSENVDVGSVVHRVQASPGVSWDFFSRIIMHGLLDL